MLLDILARVGSLSLLTTDLLLVGPRTIVIHIIGIRRSCRLRQVASLLVTGLWSCSNLLAISGLLDVVVRIPFFVSHVATRCVNHGGVTLGKL